MGWVRMKDFLVNTVDVDILEYILVKFAARIAAKVRTFLVKIKAHRGEPLKEGADDLEEAGHTLAREGGGVQMETEDNTSGDFVLRQDLGSMEKRHMDQDYSECSKERRDGISARSTTALWSKQMEEGSV